ncbi:MAG: putative arabinose efflux permease, family [Rhizobium sp.]|nr:putative arabinose efflux permease, family [Rhizobium sp.]
MAISTGGIGQAFADRNFRVYSIGSIISWITYFVQQIAFAWATWEITHSTTWLAIVPLLDIGANLLFMPVGGVLADRYDRFRMVVTAYGCDCLKTLALAILAFTGHLDLTALCICAFLHGTIHSFSVPASYGLLPRFVSRERLPAAIAVNASYTQFAIFAGPAAAGWILVNWGTAVAFTVNFVGYIVYFVTVAFLRTPQDFHQSVAPPRSVRQDIVEGIRYIIGHKGLSTLLLLVLVGDAIAGAVYQMLPAYSDLILGKGVGGVSILFGAAGLGATCAALWMAHGGAGRATPERVLLAALGVAISVYCLAASTSLVVAVGAMLLFGFSGETRRTSTVSIMQLSVDDTQRGRVMSTLFLLTRLAGGIGTVAVGVAAQHVGLRIPLLAAATVLVVVWLILFRRRREIASAFASGE